MGAWLESLFLSRGDIIWARERQGRKPCPGPSFAGRAACARGSASEQGAAAFVGAA